MRKRYKNAEAGRCRSQPGSAGRAGTAVAVRALQEQSDFSRGRGGCLGALWSARGPPTPLSCPGSRQGSGSFTAPGNTPHSGSTPSRPRSLLPRKPECPARADSLPWPLLQLQYVPTETSTHTANWQNVWGRQPNLQSGNPQRAVSAHEAPRLWGRGWKLPRFSASSGHLWTDLLWEAEGSLRAGRHPHLGPEHASLCLQGNIILGS